MELISNISNWHIIAGCVLLFIVLAPVAIQSTNKLNKIIEDYKVRLKNEGFIEYSINNELVDKVKFLPNLDETTKSNLSDVYKKVTDKYQIYHFMHNTNYGKYSRTMKCVLIESKILKLLPKFTIQPLKLKKRFIMRLDKWKAPKITFDNKIMSSLHIRSDNEEWLKTIFEDSLQAKIGDYNARTGIVYEGNNNFLLGYKMKSRLSFEIFLEMMNTCLELLDSFELIFQKKYHNQIE